VNNSPTRRTAAETDDRRPDTARFGFWLFHGSIVLRVARIRERFGHPSKQVLQFLHGVQVAFAAGGGEGCL
jgi:hypothetical protein